MKKALLIIVSVVGVSVGLVAMVMSMGVQDVAAGEPNAALEETPLTVAKALHAALASGDGRKVQDLLDPKVLILESGNAERSRDEYAAHHLPADLEFSKSTTYELQRQSGETVGDLAWVASEARLTGNRDGKPIEIASVETLVLRKSAAGWKIVHIHWSSRSSKKA